MRTRDGRGDTKLMSRLSNNARLCQILNKRDDGYEIYLNLELGDGSVFIRGRGYTKNDHKFQLFKRVYFNDIHQSVVDPLTNQIKEVHQKLKDEIDKYNERVLGEKG